MSDLPPAKSGDSSLAFEGKSLLRAVAFLKALSADDTRVSEFLERSFRGITPGVIEHWAKEHVELLPKIVRMLYFENPMVSHWTRLLLQKHCRVVDYYLGSPANTFAEMCAVNPANAKVLSVHETKMYVETQLVEAYLYFKAFTWSCNEEPS